MNGLISKGELGPELIKQIDDSTNNAADIKDIMIKKDGSVQMSGVLKTIGNSILQDIRSGNNGVFSYNNKFMITSNCYFDGAWKYSSDGKAMYMWVDADTGAVAITKWVAGVKDATITTQESTEALLTNLTGVPVSGGTMTSTLNIKDPVTGRLLQLFNYNGESLFRNYISKSDYSYFVVKPNTEVLANALKFGKSGVGEYKIYGEHNNTVSTAAPSTTLSEGAQHQVYA